MKIKFLGAAKTVTGSFFVIETSASRFAVDCGLFQGNKEIKERNYQPFRIDPASLDFLILTHAHIDHSGLIPKLHKNGFKGPIYCTSATESLVSILLPDSGHIQEMEVERKNRKNIRAGCPIINPIYTVEDAINCRSQFKSLNYDEKISIAPDVDLCLRDAGHILGSAIAEVWIKEAGDVVKLVFSGDLGNHSQRIINDPTPIAEADYVWLESTYGNRLHQANTYRIEQLAEVIHETMRKGGNLIIPAFAVARTQDLLYDLTLLAQQNKLDPEIDVYIDSPLAIAATEIFEESDEYYDPETIALIKAGFDPFELPNLKFSRTTEESKKLNQASKTIIISASGMADAGRIKHHLKNNLWRPECTVLFVGYQAEGTLGRRLIDGEKKVNIHGEQVAVRADIRQIDSYSAHADQAGLISWLKQFNQPPKTVFLIHGEEDSLQALAKKIQDELHIPVIIPNWMDEFVIEMPVSTAVAEKTVIAPAAISPQDRSLEAERMYYEFRLKANELFQKKWETQDYDAIIEKFKNALNILNAS